MIGPGYVFVFQCEVGSANWDWLVLCGKVLVAFNLSPFILIKRPAIGILEIGFCLTLSYLYVNGECGVGGGSVWSIFQVFFTE